ncbi:anhydro-N-acetylmuramic acid kinase [Aquimarina spongiae]|uniref:Anhydro-N-acetylmuramic acid kinase n=1 Tax=Aquimarina spongiae TaxID=570521 RepID=A0A1M6CXW0_9FLAO|nr:anhydro-N-acetylmuramic acid kinase [Aquimarina spongiae]SHI65819.1 anhydro-N-acetylmuramic acid kinase [Aquimarina spongiae]
MDNSPRTYKVLGLMSGTSLDGLDIAYCHFTKDNHRWTFSIEKTSDIAYSQTLKQKLKNAIHLSAIQLLALHNEYGTWLGNQSKAFITQHRLDIDFISSHGHTVFHQPDIGLTYQIGSGQHLANASGQKVICDFRTNDVIHGGQGAPLVPIGDQLLFSEYDFCLNLGGISNVSFQHQNKRIAYDISPANMLLNHICKSIDLEYDKGGKIAATGIVNAEFFENLNVLNYYKQPFPKSLGYEWFEEQVIPIINNTKDTATNLLHTAVHHIAFQIANEIKKVKKANPKMLITGGGTKNEYLIKVLSQKLEGIVSINIPPTVIIDFKEAMVFGFLGVLKDRNEVNCLKSVTGATQDSSSGVIYNPA